MIETCSEHRRGPFNGRGRPARQRDSYAPSSLIRSGAPARWRSDRGSDPAVWFRNRALTELYLTDRGAIRPLGLLRSAARRLRRQDGARCQLSVRLAGILWHMAARSTPRRKLAGKR